MKGLKCCFQGISSSCCFRGEPSPRPTALSFIIKPTESLKSVAPVLITPVHKDGVFGDAATLHSLSFTALRATASALLDVDDDAIDFGLLKDEISSNPDLLFFIKHFLQASIDTLHFFTTLKDYLSKAQETELLIREAVLLFEDANDPSAALEKLRHFKGEGDLFTEKFIDELKLVCERQQITLHAMLLRKRDLDRKLRKVKAWRKVWNVVCSVAFAAVLICSVVLAAVAAPPAVTATIAAASGVLAPLQQWVDSIWEHFESPYVEEKRVTELLGKAMSCAIHEVNGIKSLADELEAKITSIIHNVEFAVDGEDEVAMKVAMFEIKLKAEAFAKSVEELEREVDLRCDVLKRASVSVLQTVTD